MTGKGGIGNERKADMTGAFDSKPFSKVSLQAALNTPTGVRDTQGNPLSGACKELDRGPVPARNGPTRCLK